MTPDTNTLNTILNHLHDMAYMAVRDAYGLEMREDIRSAHECAQIVQEMTESYIQAMHMLLKAFSFALGDVTVTACSSVAPADS